MLIVDKSKILNLLFPPYCLNCQQYGAYVCPACFGKIKINSLAESDALAKNKPKYLDKLLIASDWQNPLLRQLIYEFKYRFAKDLKKPLGLLLIRFLSQITLPQPALIVPIPLHPKRLRWRGFNQAQELGKELAKEYNINMANLLKRAHPTKAQMSFKNKTQRVLNIKNAFVLNPEFTGPTAFTKSTILLLDDICTTGATLNQAAKALKRTGVKNVWGLTLARA